MAWSPLSLKGKMIMVLIKFFKSLFRKKGTNYIQNKYSLIFYNLMQLFNINRINLESVICATLSLQKNTGGHLKVNVAYKKLNYQ